VRAGSVRERAANPLASVEHDACRDSESSPPSGRAVRLPALADLAKVSPEEVPSLITQLAALMAGLAPRLVVIDPTHQTQATQPKWTTAKEVAAAFSLRLDRVYELARTKQIPSHPIGRQVRFDLEEVRKALSEGRLLLFPANGESLRRYGRSGRQDPA
jgi:excisionase family DNA binding protein